MLPRIVFFCLPALLLYNSGCLKPKISDLEFFTVETEAVDVQSLALVKLSGRISNLNEQSVETCGFIWSTNESEISGPAPAGGQLIPLPPPNGNGAFVYDFEVPNQGKVYFFRAFAQLGERHVFADVIRTYALGAVVLQTDNWTVENDTAWVTGILVGLSALHLEVDSFGHILSETNTNPELDCADCQVSVKPGTNDDGPFTSKFDSLKFNTAYFARAYAVSGTKRFYSTRVDTIEVGGGWRRIENFRNYRGAVAASSENHNKAFLGFGCEDIINCEQAALPSDIWAFNPGSDNFTLETNFPSLLKRNLASAFVIGDTLYYIFGAYQEAAGSDTLFLRDFWKYDIPSKTWSKGTDPDFSCARRARAIAFSLQGKGYVGAGVDQFENALQDFWEYNPATGAWRQVAPLPTRTNAGGPNLNWGRSDAAYFTIGNIGYAGGGKVGPTILRDFWKFTPPADSNSLGQWEFCSFFDKGLPRADAIFFSIGNKGYYGLGASNTNAVLDDFYQFDSATSVWTQLEHFPGGKRYGAFAFSLNDFGYVGSGFERIITNTISTDFRADMWKYEPKK